MDEEDDQEQDQSDSKSDSIRRQHVPYILNGELYRIESQVGDNVTVKCCSCPPDRIYRGSVRSTGNFHMHIKRRHASLLGKLHEMKVAALVERRDRITKNRRIAKCRKKTTSPVPVPVAVPVISSLPFTSTIELPKNVETHELKIKTVFQRHKQEHHKQEEAAAIRTSVSVCDSSLDNNSQSSGKLSLSPTPDNKRNNNNNNKNNIQNLHDTNNLSEESTEMGTATNDILPPMICIPRILPACLIKPEQQHQVTMEQPEAMDLSRSSSLQSDDLDPIAVSHSMQNVQLDSSSGQELAAYVNGSPREVLMQIGNTLGNIKDELQKRNQIERNRLLFEMAKFKYLHPHFSFDSPQ